MDRRGGRSAGIACIAVGFGLAFGLAACAGGSATTAPPATGTAAPAASTAFTGQTVDLAAKGGLFQPGTFEVAAGQDFEIRFVNDDPELSHTVYVTEGERPKTMLSLDEYEKGPYPFKGEYTKAGGTATYHVGALPAGTYQFFCPPHMDMVATLVVR